jgi:hypothetical protein
MGAMTDGQMVVEVRLAVGNPSETALSTTRIYRYLDWAYRHVCRPNVHPHREMRVSTTFTIATGKREYRLKTDIGIQDFYSMHALTNETQAYRLVPMDMRRQEEGMIPNTRPCWYDLDYTTVTEEPQILLYPNVSSTNNGQTMRLRYWRQPPDFAGGGSTTTVLVEDWDEVIVVGAIWRSWRHQRAYERAELVKAEFGQLTNEIGNRLRDDLQDKDWEIAAHIEPHTGVSLGGDY